MTPFPLARRTWPILTTLAVAVWLGSLAHTLLTVSVLFASFPKATSATAIEAAPVVFAATERMHVGLALLAVVGVILWRRHACNRARRWISYCLFAATALAIVQLAAVTPQLNTLRLAGESEGELFGRLHHLSSAQYLAQTACLLVATLLLPAAFDESTCVMKH